MLDFVKSRYLKINGFCNGFSFLLQNPLIFKYQLLTKSNISISVIRKKSNILYLNFDYKFDLQIQIVAFFRKKVF